MAHNFQEALLQELSDLFELVKLAATSEDGRHSLFAQLGWSTDPGSGFPEDELLAALGTVSTAFDALQTLLAAGPPSTLSELRSALDAVSSVADGVQALGALANAPAEFADAGGELLNALLVTRLRQGHRILYQLAKLLTIVQTKQIEPVVISVPAAGGDVLLRGAVAIEQLEFGRIIDLFRDPVGTLKREYGLTQGLTDAAATSDLLFPRIAQFLNALGVQAIYGVDPALGTDFGVVGNQIASHALTLFAALPVTSNATAGLGFSATLDEVLGFVVVPFGVFQFSETLGSWQLTGTIGGDAPGLAISSSGVVFPDDSNAASATLSLTALKLPEQEEADSGEADAVSFRIGGTTGTRLEIGQFQVTLDAGFSATTRTFGFTVGTGSSALIIAGGDGDGLMGKILPAEMRAAFDLTVGWSNTGGLAFKGSGGLEVTLPARLEIGNAITVDMIRLRIDAGDTGVDVGTLATVAANIGPVAVTATDLGVGALFTAPDGGGNLGPLNADVRFRLPTGAGIEVNAGPVSGGGFLFIDEKAGRYAGACELSVYGVAVKAFGVIDTKLPDGTSGFSFVIVISAEFTPIQLGFGFTLLGVGGLIGINRTLDQDALRGVIRSHGLDNILFPHDVIENAPAIIHDLTAIFPASEGHYVFGPLAKFGWGTPAVIDAELGLILVLPGPLLALLGEVHSTLPNQESALVNINIAIAGVLDFPQKKFSLDGSLHDSKVGQYTLSGDMAMRLSWGANSSFALSVGGFNPGFTPPSGFPALARVAVDMGLGGNPAIRHEGYLAVTSNTLQIGARSQITAHGGGIDLDGHLGWDALFVLSPFSFTATFDAGVSVRFHGHGIGVHLHGEISGPSPWRVQGEVCVSILFWDACLGFDKTFGGEPVVELPAIDPFLGSPPTAALVDQDVVGLKNALEDARNWSSLAPPGSFTVVTLAARKEGDEAPPPVDPLGAGVLHQRVVPLNRKITLYGGVKPLGPGQYNVDSVTVSNGIAVSHSFVQDDFAPASFKKMSDAEKLSNRSFEPMDAGVKLVSDEVKVGSIVPHGVTYDTIVVGGPPGSPPSPDPQPGPQFTLTARHLAGMTARSATALFGMRVAGAERFVDPTAKLKVELLQELFVVAQRGALAAAQNFVTTTTRSASTLALEAAVAANPSLASQLYVVPFHELPVPFPQPP